MKFCRSGKHPFSYHPTKNYYCKKCQVEREREKKHKRRKENPEKFIAEQRIQQKKFRLKKYNLSEIEYENMLKNQNGVCAICKQPETVFDSRLGAIKSLSIDHSHETGKVRALLCHKCNAAYGLLRESRDLILKLLQYHDHHCREGGDTLK